VSPRHHSGNPSLQRMFQPFPFNSVGGRPRAAGSFAVSLKNQIKKEIPTKEEVEDEHLLAGFLRKPSSDTFISPSSKKIKADRLGRQLRVLLQLV